MDAVTQQNAALVEEAAAAACSLEDQAASLAQLVSTFALESDGVSGKHMAAPALATASTPAASRRLALQ